MDVGRPLPDSKTPKTKTAAAAAIADIQCRFMFLFMLLTIVVRSVRCLLSSNSLTTTDNIF